jgi:hypothetical protein
MMKVSVETFHGKFECTLTLTDDNIEVRPIIAPNVHHYRRMPDRIDIYWEDIHLINIGFLTPFSNSTLTLDCSPHQSTENRNIQKQQQEQQPSLHQISNEGTLNGNNDIRCTSIQGVKMRPILVVLSFCNLGDVATFMNSVNAHGLRGRADRDVVPSILQTSFLLPYYCHQLRMLIGAFQSLYSVLVIVGIFFYVLKQLDQVPEMVDQIPMMIWAYVLRVPKWWMYLCVLPFLPFLSCALPFFTIFAGFIFARYVAGLLLSLAFLSHALVAIKTLTQIGRLCGYAKISKTCIQSICKQQTTAPNIHTDGKHQHHTKTQ